MPSSNTNRPGGGSDGKSFQPERYLEKRNGTTYLPLKWRLAWLRADHPEASVETRLVKYEGGTAIFQAEIKLADGALATGWGARREIDDHDSNLGFLTEAENQALDRALAVLGYGIEYAGDFDLPNDGEAIPLRDNAVDEEEEASIEVPLNLDDQAVVGDEEAEEVGGVVRVNAKGQPEPPEEPEEAEETAPAPRLAPAPVPLRAVSEEPARFSPEPVPLRPNRSTTTSGPVAVPNLPTPLPARPAPIRRPGPGPTQAETTPPPGPTPLTSPAVEDRIKGITDSQLVLLIKQIFYEARRLHNLNEDAVDRSSVKRYGVPVNGLALEQAEEYLERIKTAPRSPKR